MLKWLALLVSCVTLNAALSDNLRLRTPPVPPGIPTKVPATNILSAAVLIRVDVRTAIQAGGGKAEDIAYYFRGVAAIFASMETNGTFSVEYLKAELSKSPPPLTVDLSQIHNYIVCAYDRAYFFRDKVEGMSITQYLTYAASTFRYSIEIGIREGGKANVLSN